MLNVIMITVIILNVVMPSVVAPIIKINQPLLKAPSDSRENRKTVNITLGPGYL